MIVEKKQNGKKVRSVSIMNKKPTFVYTCCASKLSPVMLQSETDKELYHNNLYIKPNWKDHTEIMTTSQLSPDTYRPVCLVLLYTSISSR